MSDTSQTPSASVSGDSAPADSHAVTAPADSQAADSQAVDSQAADSQAADSQAADSQAAGSQAGKSQAPALPIVTPDEEQFSTGRGRSEEAYAPFIGDQLGTYVGYATAASDREHVASGGLVTTLLAHALRTGVVDAVAVARSDFSEGKIGYKFSLVTDPDQVQDYGTSAYFNIPLERHWKEIDAYPGKVAVCALPCHTGMFRRRIQEGRGMSNTVLLISLFCGHNNEPELLRFVFRQYGIDESEVTDMRVDRSYLGGNVWVTKRDGTRVPVKFRHFNVYRSLWFFSKQMCRYCDDHLGGFADLSIGDVFVPEYRGSKIKHSAVIVRTPIGQELLQSARDQSVVTLEEVTTETVFRAQKRVIVPSGDLVSRYHACRIAGFTAKQPKEGRFRWRTFLTYSLLHLNDRISQTAWGRWIIGWIPRPLLYLYIATIKLINNSLRPKA